MTRLLDVVTIGPFVAGEIPVAIPVRFLEDPQDLTGWALDVTVERNGVELQTWGADATWGNSLEAEALLQMPELELDHGTPASFEVLVWAGDGHQRIASQRIKFNVGRTVGTVPAI